MPYETLEATCWRAHPVPDERRCRTPEEAENAGAFENPPDPREILGDRFQQSVSNGIVPASIAAALGLLFHQAGGFVRNWGLGTT